MRIQDQYIIIIINHHPHGVVNLPHKPFAAVPALLLPPALCRYKLIFLLFLLLRPKGPLSRVPLPFAGGPSLHMTSLPPLRGPMGLRSRKS